MQQQTQNFALGCLCGAVGTVCIIFYMENFLQWTLLASIHEDANNHESFIAAGNHLLKWIVSYRRDLVKKLPVISRVEPNYLSKLLPNRAPQKSESWNSILSDINKAILPGLTHWESNSKFFAYFKPHSSYPAVLGELLSAGLNVMGFDWIASPACTELEVLVLDWLAKFLNLPEKFLNMSEGPGGSVIQGSAGEAAIVVLLAAIIRRQKEAERGMESNVTSKSYSSSSRDNLVVFSSDQTHAIITKACMILGITNHRLIKTKSSHNYAMQAADLRMAIEDEIAQGRVPLAVVATTGTTSSCAFDPLVEIGEVCQQYGNLWLHVDAAYGGAYACLPELEYLFRGLNHADSFVVNCHKKLLCPFDLACMYVADRRPVLAALSLQPEYLRNAASDSGAVVDYEHWQLPLGRRFRALKLWFVMRRFGTEGLRSHVRKGLQLSAYFASLLNEYPTLFTLVTPVSLSLVCFRLKDSDEVEQKAFLDNIKATGDCFVIHSKLDGKVVIRFACGGMEQSKEDVLSAFKVILTEARKVKRFL